MNDEWKNWLENVYPLFGGLCEKLFAKKSGICASCRKTIDNCPSVQGAVITICKNCQIENVADYIDGKRV